GWERVLEDLEEANAFVVALDAARSWFRYHHLFADLLQRELRRTDPGEVTALHQVASRWFAGHGFTVEAVRHAQAAREWDLAGRLLRGAGLRLARQRGALPAVVAEERRLQAAAEAPDAAGLGEDLRALALINLGIAEYGTARFEGAEPHLEQGVALARRIGRPYLEFLGLAHQAALHVGWSFARAAEHSRQAIELAERHGWTDEPTA